MDMELVRANAFKVLDESKEIAGMTVRQYFSTDALPENIDSRTAEVLDRCSDETIEELLMRAQTTDDDRARDDFAFLYEVSRHPLNHLDILDFIYAEALKK